MFTLLINNIQLSSLFQCQPPNFIDNKILNFHINLEEYPLQKEEHERKQTVVNMLIQNNQCGNALSLKILF